MKPRVFVSSVIDGFHGMREAARRGIDAADCEPILVNEDFPSSPESPRNACLNAVESSDVYLVIVGARSGSESPSGRPIVEEELDHAITRKRPVLAFLQDVARDPAAARLADRLSDYVHGSFRTTFSTESELEKQVEDALKRIGLDGMKETNHPESVTRDLKAAKKRGRETILRFVLRPERREEVFDVVKLESEEFRDDVLRLAHDRQVRLFRYEAPKHFDKTSEGIVFHQETPTGSSGVVGDVSLEIRMDGSLIIDSQVSGLEDRNDHFSGFRIPEEKVRSSLRTSFRFAAALYGFVDRYLRHQRYFNGASLADIDNRQLVSGPPTSTMTTGFSIRKDPISSGQPRLVSRADLEQPDREIEMITAFFHRGFDQ